MWAIIGNDPSYIQFGYKALWVALSIASNTQKEDAHKYGWDAYLRVVFLSDLISCDIGNYLSIWKIYTHEELTTTTLYP